MSLKRNTQVFALINGKVTKGKVTRVTGNTISIKVGTKSHKVDSQNVFTKEVPALRAQMKIFRSTRAGYRKNITTTKRELRTFEKAVKNADKMITKIQGRIQKVSA
jgi:hypothetical protein